MFTPDSMSVYRVQLSAIRISQVRLDSSDRSGFLILSEWICNPDLDDLDRNKIVFINSHLNRHSPNAAIPVTKCNDHDSQVLTGITFLSQTKAKKMCLRLLFKGFDL